MEKLLQPYEGSEPYVFVSCCHNDADKVSLIFQRLQNEGINIFYNQDGDFRADLSDNVVKHIKNCQRFIAFHSKNSKNSAYCKNEVSFACRCHQKVISVYLDSVELSLGVQMAVHQFPAINFYEYKENEFENFYSELLNQIKSSSVSLGDSVTNTVGIVTGDDAVSTVNIKKFTVPTSVIASGAVVATGLICSFAPEIFKAAKNFFKGNNSSKPKSSKLVPAVESHRPVKTNPLRCASPYEGNKPYAFISYSHDDLNVVLEILSKLQGGGLRFWYDAGIQHGSEWDECIAEHICSCECMVAFHSKNSNRSPHCKNEISFLNFKGSDKKILSVYLDNVELSIGTQMNINRFQAIKFYDYQQKENFYSALIESPIIQTCLQ